MIDGLSVVVAAVLVVVNLTMSFQNYIAPRVGRSTKSVPT